MQKGKKQGGGMMKQTEKKIIVQDYLARGKEKRQTPPKGHSKYIDIYLNSEENRKVRGKKDLAGK